MSAVALVEDAALAAYTAEATLQMQERPAAEGLQSLSTYLVGEFERAVVMRGDTEKRWLKDLRQYRGQYEEDEITKMKNRSKTFTRKTRVKVKTIDSRVADLLFPAGTEKNWTIEPTPKPMIGPEQKNQILAEMKQAAQAKMQQQQQAVQQGAQVTEQPGGAKTLPNGEQLVTAMPPDPTDDQINEVVNEFVKKAAKRMSTTIDDQLTESRYKEVCVRTIHSGHVYGIGILKGPLVEQKLRTRFTKVQVQGVNGAQPTMRWQPKTESFTVPYVEAVPVWRWYPDMSVTELEDCQYVYERHFLSRARINELTKRKSFNKQILLEMMKSNPKGTRSRHSEEYAEQQLRTMGDRLADSAMRENNTYEMIERWGWLSGQQLKDAGVTVADNRVEEAFFCNIWMTHNGQVVRTVMQPIDGTTWPYQLYYFDKDETSIFPEGLPSVMRDEQSMLNAATRTMLDNAAITSGPQLEVNVEMLAKNEKAEDIYPWKVWKVNGSKNPGKRAIQAIDIPNHLEDMVRMAALFEQNADEVTAIPRYMSGENATQGAAGTAAGMSMLMAAANIVIKDLVTAWDEGITRPFLQALYHWNMKYNPDDAIKGDYDVKARGTASLVAKEVRARTLNEFRAGVSNPADAPYIKRHELLIATAEAQELSGVVKTKEEFEAEQNTPEARQAKAMQESLQKGQVELLETQVALAKANAALSDKKVEEIAGKLELMMAQTKVAMTEVIERSVSAIYAALQAGGAATNNPFTAPAADEILKSAGFVDKTPNPSIAQLNTTPVQASNGTEQLLNKGQAFVTPPRDGQPGKDEQAIQDPANSTNEAPKVDQPEPNEQQIPDLKPATGEVGKHAGIETERIEQ